MKRTGRPAQVIPPIEVHIHLRLRPGEDDDLIAFFRNPEMRCMARAVKAALRMGGMPSSPAETPMVDDGAGDALADLLL